MFEITVFRSCLSSSSTSSRNHCVSDPSDGEVGSCQLEELLRYYFRPLT